MARSFKRDAQPRSSSLPTASTGSTSTTPENEQAGTLKDPNAVTGLLLYGTDSLHAVPRTVRTTTIGSDPSKSDIVISSPFVSAQHLRLERKGTAMRGIDLKSKNGTFVDGERERAFDVKPGRTFVLGARPHRFLALNDQMRASYPQLQDILGTEAEHVIGSARETPSPSDVIVAAISGAPMLIGGDPHCDQDRLARVVHAISRYRERALVELTAADIPTERKAREELIKQTAARSTLVLTLNKKDKELDPTFVAMMFKPKYQVRVIVVARDLELADKVLGRQHAANLQEISLRPLARRLAAIDRLFDRMLEEQHSQVRMADLTPVNQDAVRNYSWPDNFQSLRQAARWLTGIYKYGTIHQAAQALRVSPSSMYYWYSNVLKLSEPLSRRLNLRGIRV